MKQLLIPLSQLELDPDNPRLPAGIADGEEPILEFILRTGALEELALSMLDNGYFEAERLIVTYEPKTEIYTVVEGNRRLATLQILHGALGDIPLPDVEPTEEQLARLLEIPCLLVDHREEVDRYLAYRHIGGMKTWGAEARARFTKTMVREAAENGESDPFRNVGRKIGSNSQGVRNSYIAITVLEFARLELNLSTTYLQYQRFGVWIRSMNSGDIRDYMGLGRPRDLAEVEQALEGIDRDRLAEVIADLSIRPDGRKAIVADSRDITDYGRILVDDNALSALRKHEDFSVAKQIVDRRTFPTRIESAANAVNAIVDELSVVADRELAETIRVPTDRLAGLARTMRALVHDLLSTDD